MVYSALDGKTGRFVATGKRMANATSCQLTRPKGIRHGTCCALGRQVERSEAVIEHTSPHYLNPQRYFKLDHAHTNTMRNAETCNTFKRWG